VEQEAAGVRAPLLKGDEILLSNVGREARLWPVAGVKSLKRGREKNGTKRRLKPEEGQNREILKGGGKSAMPARRRMSAGPGPTVETKPEAAGGATVLL